MKLDKILAIGGKPGLFEIVAQTRTSIVAQSIIDKKRIAVNMQHNISVLSEIAIYTLTEEVPLKEVMTTIAKKENYKPIAISPKANKDDLEAYFFDVLPNYDEDRVYASDIKKVIKWYNILQENNLIAPEEQESSSEEE